MFDKDIMLFSLVGLIGDSNVKGTDITGAGIVRPTMSLFIYPLTKQRGGLELAFIILSHPKANQRRRTYVIK
nr:MAG TPA_asm: hypothetical protein [Caudoviricetes sp.]